MRRRRPYTQRGPPLSVYPENPRQYQHITLSIPRNMPLHPAAFRRISVDPLLTSSRNVIIRVALFYLWPKLLLSITTKIRFRCDACTGLTYRSPHSMYVRGSHTYVRHSHVCARVLKLNEHAHVCLPSTLLPKSDARVQGRHCDQGPGRHPHEERRLRDQPESPSGLFRPYRDSRARQSE